MRHMNETGSYGPVRRRVLAPFLLQSPRSLWRPYVLRLLGGLPKVFALHLLIHGEAGLLCCQEAVVCANEPETWVADVWFAVSSAAIALS